MDKLKRKLLFLLGNEEGISYSTREIIRELNVEDHEEIHNLIEFLLKDKVIIKNEEKYSINLSKNQTIGIFKGNKKGFGFLTPFSKDDDFYVYSKNINGALDGDIVIADIIRKKKKDKKAEVKINRVIEDLSKKYIGVFYSNGENGYVILDNENIKEYIFISKKNVNNATDSDKVMINIIQRAFKNKGTKGIVVEILGNKEQVGLDVLSIVKQKDIDVDFSEIALEEAERINDNISEEEIRKRLDLRNETIITVDGEDSKDLDDAISIKKLTNGNYLLGVHIADVSHYIRENSQLDKEARERATSVYLVDRVIPMLPKKISNGICSLNPKVDRLTLSCIMEVDYNGNVVSNNIVETVIKTTERMTYSDVKKILENEKDLVIKYNHILDLIKTMEELTKILINKRKNRGSIDFDTQESKVILDDKGKPIEIKRYERNIATRIIEEFMILANETVSYEYNKKKLPFVYRVHDKPDSEKIGSFFQFMLNFGYVPETKEDVTPKLLQKILDEVKGEQGEFAINQVMLRSLQKAKYSSNNTGHFGLASSYYSHFTSPIRRYPDLQIHRIIKNDLNRQLDSNYIERLEERVIQVSQHSSKKELLAQEAERDSVNLKKAEYMSNKIGEIFQGIVTGITEYGIYVQLENTVEGFIHISKMSDDYYIFNEDNYSLSGEKFGKNYTFGDKMIVKVSNVNIERREVDFSILEEFPKNVEEEF